MKDHDILFKAAMVNAMLDGRKTQTRRVLNFQPSFETNKSGLRLGFFTCLVSKHGPTIYADTERELASRILADSRLIKVRTGHRLWVKETWADVNSGGAPAIAYRANDDLRELMEEDDFLDHTGAFNYADERLEFGENGLQFASWANDLLSGVEGRWRSPLHMKRWISRLTLPVTNVRVQRLQDISKEDCISEGIERIHGGYHDDDDVYRNYLDDERGFGGFGAARLSFMTLWDSINAKPKPVGGKSVTHYVSYPWDGEARTETHRGLPHHIIPNPWVAAYSFDVLKQNINQMGEAA